MIFTIRFKVLLGILAALIFAGGLFYNQFILAQRLNAQAKFDNKVMSNDEKIWGQLQKMASDSAKAKITPTPSPKLLVGKKLTK